MPDDFDWNDVEDDLVVGTVGAIAVYENPKGDLVIRQQAVGPLEEDGLVVVPRRFVPDLVRKLLATAELDWGRVRLVKGEEKDV